MLVFWGEEKTLKQFGEFVFEERDCATRDAGMTRIRAGVVFGFTAVPCETPPMAGVDEFLQQ